MRGARLPDTQNTDVRTALFIYARRVLANPLFRDTPTYSVVRPDYSSYSAYAAHMLVYSL